MDISMTFSVIKKEWFDLPVQVGGKGRGYLLTASRNWVKLPVITLSKEHSKRKRGLAYEASQPATAVCGGIAYIIIANWKFDILSYAMHAWMATR